MADQNKTETAAADVETPAEVKPSTAKKQRSPRPRKAAAVEAKPEASAAGVSVTKPRKYGEQEKAEKLKLIETQVAEGKSKLKDAIKSAGISEQTYYQWKRAAKLDDKRESLTTDDELADLVRLENENQRLRKLLAEKLRAENAELRKRLGLDE
ncbi:transposase [Sinorhizobium alkalisoli]|uniref:Transcriptional regulator n=1 Tax=Sinorhizobium alkalisoli TaxID=1752398 RepID=A0A1E3V5W2_9HYPH|nr:transposase [Sinorhizobium alkalisoli]MCG5480882.1 transposase [Sinorhizobium alkalisoli]ODR88845.1 transcriptional regulator [Sinorhizobium alkalisoli]